MKQQNGFTLMELMVVIAIMATLAAVAVPNFVAYRDNQSLGAGAREILGAIKKTRMRAVIEQRTALITFDPDADTYLTFLDDGSGGGVAGNDVQDGTEATIVSGKLPGNVDMTGAAFGTFGAKNRFDMRGMASFNGNVTLANSRGLIRRVIVLQSGHARIIVP